MHEYLGDSVQASKVVCPGLLINEHVERNRGKIADGDLVRADNQEAGPKFDASCVNGLLRAATDTIRP